MTPKQALSLTPLILLSTEFYSNIYIIHNENSSSSFLLVIIPLTELLFRNHYFIVLSHGVLPVILNKKSNPISHKNLRLKQTIL